MTLALIRLTVRECFRRSFPYVLVGGVSLLALCSHLFSAFSFGADDREAANLAISAVFLTGLIHAAFQATTTIRGDYERGTLGLMMSQPVTPGLYVAGRFAGLLLSAAILCLAVALLMVGVFALPLSRVEAASVAPALAGGFLRMLPPLAILQAAGLAASALAPGLLGPLSLLALFLAGSLAEGTILRFLLPDFALFGLDAGAGVSGATALAYGSLHTTVYIGLAYLALSWRAPMKSQA